MSQIERQVSEQFYLWETRGRGWRLYDHPVRIEPPFCPFTGHCLAPLPSGDDGRKPTFLSSLVRKLSQSLSGQPAAPEEEIEEEEEPEPDRFERDELIELQASLPSDLDVKRETFEHFLLHLSACVEPISWEIVGTAQEIVTQFALHPQDTALVEKQLAAYVPEGVFLPRQGVLEKAWQESESGATSIIEFGLAHEMMVPLAIGKIDAFIGLVGALGHLRPRELGLFQVLFQPVTHAWSESILRSVTHADGKPFFINRPELAEQARTKIARPLYAAVVRLITRASDLERAWALARELASPLGTFAHPHGNELIPLPNEEYPPESHEEDVLRRQTRRPGMILSQDELLGFVHLPSSAVCTPKLQRESIKTKAAPLLTQAFGVLLGENSHAGRSKEVRLSAEERVRHTHILGGTGMGKSTLLFNLIKQDLDNGEGVAVLDPHGDLIDRILGAIPSERIHDVIVVDPSDEAYSVGFNILSAHADFEKTILASDLVSIFQRLSASWGDQLSSVLNNAIRAFLESDQGGTLSDLRRFLLEAEYRNSFLKTVRDPDILYYWKKAFPQLSGNKSIGSVITRLDTFLSPKPIRYMVSQRVNHLNFSEILDGRKIFLARLPQGQMGKENAFLLGSLLVAKFQQMAMSRQRMAASQRRDFWLYIDEFHHFITPSMAEILTGARKYRIGLILAHQELRQLDRDSEVAAAVLSSCTTRIVFRVGDADAKALASGFSFFEARDLQNLGKGEAIARVERSDGDFNLKVLLPKEPDPTEAAQTRARVVRISREKYATAREIIEETLRQQGKDAEQVESEKLQAKISSSAKKAPSEPAGMVSEELKKPEPVVASSPATSVPETILKASVPEPIPTPMPGSPPADLGRGGAQHKALQLRLKKIAENLQFAATIEKGITNGSIDLFLENARQSIACELSFTTTIDHEVGNVIKCLKAGIEHVAVICIEESRLAKIRHAVSSCLSEAEAARVGYYVPDTFIAHLEHLASLNTSAPPAPKLRLGKYKVTKSQTPLTDEERKRKEEEMLKTIAAAMKKKPK